MVKRAGVRACPGDEEAAGRELLGGRGADAARPAGDQHLAFLWRGLVIGQAFRENRQPCSWRSPERAVFPGKEGARLAWLHGVSHLDLLVSSRLVASPASGLRRWVVCVISSLPLSVHTIAAPHPRQ